MIIPSDAAAREQLYDEVIRQCDKSQDDRRASYEVRRNYYIMGAADESIEVAFNKIYPHLDTVVSFLFASETTKFSVHPDVSEVEMEHWRSGVFGDALNESWHNSNTDSIVSLAILWSLVYDSMVVKVNREVNEQSKELHMTPFLVHPASFGVYREDVNTLDRQQALCQTFYVSEKKLRWELRDHPDREAILSSLAPAQNEEQKPDTALMRMVVGEWNPLGQTPPANGSVMFNLSSDRGYRPEELDDLRALKELWIWDDDRNEYRVVTRPENGGISIYDRLNPYLPGEHPFVKFTPRPMPFYVWGESEAQGLIPLQDWRTEYIEWVRSILKKQLKPPTWMSGMGPIEETALAAYLDGSIITDAASGGMGGASPQVKSDRPPMPQDVYRMLGEIDAAFNEYSGLPNTVQGKGEVGVRSGRQADSLARLGSSRIKKRSLVIEDTLEKMAYLYARLMQKHSPTKYKDSKGNIFVLDQFTKQYSVKVDAHSNSPVFIEDKRDLAFSMLERKLVTPQRAVEMIDPPDKAAVIRELAQIQQGEAAAQKAQEEAALKEKALAHAPEGFMQKILAKFFPG